MQTHLPTQNRYPTTHADSSHAETRTAYELKKGECVINETIESEAEVLYDPLNGQYEDKKVHVKKCRFDWSSR